MYLIYSCVPHFVSNKVGPELPRQTGYTSSLESAKQRAKEDQGFFRNIND
jgi:hypothetical protein